MTLSILWNGIFTRLEQNYSVQLTCGQLFNENWKCVDGAIVLVPHCSFVGCASKQNFCVCVHSASIALLTNGDNSIEYAAIVHIDNTWYRFE